MTPAPPPPPFNGPPVAGRPGYPPAPPMGAFEQPVGRVPVVAWMIPVAALLAVIGVFTPWFHSSLVLDGVSHKLSNALYSWRDGKIGLIGPIALVIVSVAVVRLMTGRTGRFARFGTNPVVAAARGAIVIGLATVVCCIIAWFLVPSNYYFDTVEGRLSTSSLITRAHDNGHTASLERGPQIGFVLTVVAAVIALVAGVLMLMMRDKTTAVSTFSNGGWQNATTPPPAGAPAGGPGGFAPPPASYAAPSASPAPSPAPSFGGPNAAPPPISGWTPPTSAPPAPPAASAPSTGSAPAASGDGWSSATSYSHDDDGTASDGRVDLNK